MYALKSYCVLGISAQFSNWLPQDTEGLISSLPTIKNLEFCLIYWSQTLVKVSAPHLIQNTLTCLNNKNSSPRGSTRTDSSAFTHWQAPPNSLSRQPCGCAHTTYDSILNFLSDLDFCHLLNCPFSIQIFLSCFTSPCFSSAAG